MRLWLSEEERRPDPAPARADARKALVAGTIGWLVVAAGCLVFREPLEAAGLGWYLVAALVGVALGVAGIVVVQAIRRRAGRPGDDGSGVSA
ncbi:DUF2530 domain-containing protein [Agromyces italicus]|uniref:DUF2530 domain-containing protein n=1 Tax=Agromyces italicus TaxID=279572 RepID=UPI0003B71583|nr:DUF2530 domain-containing protein [Agromyces italicus]